MTSPPSAIPAPLETRSTRIVLRGSLVVGACLAAGQALGLVRHLTAAYLLGTGPQADAIAVAFAPVDLWWAVLSTTAIFGYGPRLAEDTSGTVFKALARVALCASLLAAAVTLGLARSAVQAMAPGLSPATTALATRLLRVTSLALPAVSLSALYTALLFSRRRFAFAAFRQGVMNICTVAAALLLYARLGVFGFAAGFAAGAWLQFGGAGLISRPLLSGQSGAAAQPALRTLVDAPLGVLCYSGLIGLMPLAARALASTLGSGATAAFDYCLKMLGVPLALLVTPVSSSLLAEISRFRRLGDPDRALEVIRKATGWTALASGALVTLLIWLGPRLVAAAFERGRFDAASTAMGSSMLAGLAPVLLVWSLLDVVSRALFSLGRLALPLLAAALALAVTCTLSVAVPVLSVRWVGVPVTLGFSAGAALVTSQVWGNSDSSKHSA